MPVRPNTTLRCIAAVRGIRDTSTLADRGTGFQPSAGLASGGQHEHEQVDVIAGTPERRFLKLERMLRDATDEALAFNAFLVSHWKRPVDQPSRSSYFRKMLID